MRNIFGDQGNMERNFWEQGNSVKVKNLYLFLKNKGTTVNFHREQGNMHPSRRPSLLANQNRASYIFAAAFLSATLFLACVADETKSWGLVSSATQATLFSAPPSPPSNLPAKAEESSAFGPLVLLFDLK